MQWIIKLWPSNNGSHKSFEDSFHFYGSVRFNLWRTLKFPNSSTCCKWHMLTATMLHWGQVGVLLFSKPHNLNCELALFPGGASRKGRSKKEAVDNTNRPNPGGHERKLIEKLQNTEKKAKEWLNGGKPPPPIFECTSQFQTSVGHNMKSEEVNIQHFLYSELYIFL